VGFEGEAGWVDLDASDDKGVLGPTVDRRLARLDSDGLAWLLASCDREEVVFDTESI
jgi:hypothetical protein